MSTGDAAIVAVAAGLLIAPIVLFTADANLSQPHRFEPASAAAVTALVGLLGFVALSRPTAAAAISIALLAVWGVGAAIVDVVEQRLPNRLTGSLFALSALTVAAVSAVIGDGAGAFRAVVGAALVLAGGLAMMAVHAESVGWGDIKILPSLGALLGWAGMETLVAGVGLWLLLILVTATGMTFLPGTRTTPVPYGPALVLGTIGALMLGA